MQIYNGYADHHFRSGIAEWIKLLLNGKRLSIIAGNDAHGNFARFRQIKFPFLSMTEHEHQIFGKGRTAVFLKNSLTRKAVLQALVQGRSAITDGPMAEIQAISDEKSFVVGDTIPVSQVIVRIRAATSPEFGEFDTIELYCGNYETGIESCEFKENKIFNSDYFEKTISIPRLPKRGYVRLVCRTKHDQERYWCLTNPIWIDQN